MFHYEKCSHQAVHCANHDQNMFILTLSHPESIMETCYVVLTFESVDEIQWCDHSNETSSAVLLNGSNCFTASYKMKFGMLNG